MLHRRARIGDIICEFMFEQSFGSKDSRRPRWFAGAVAVFIVLTIIPGMETYAVITGFILAAAVLIFFRKMFEEWKRGDL